MSNTFKTLPMLAVFSGMMLAGILGSSAPSIADEPRDMLSADSPELAEVTVGQGFMDVQLHSEPKRSTLRIAGPQGYAMTIRAEGQIYITADLLLDAEPSRHKLEEIEAAKARGVENPGTADWQALPEGTYVYEIIADDGTGRPDKQVGRFVVEGGTVTLLDDRQSSAYQPNWIERLAGAALDLLVPSAHAQGGTFDNFIDILDSSGNDFTDITLHNTNDNNVAMFNDGGELKFGTGTAGSDDVLMTFSAVLGKVGLHTEAPAELLHITSPGLNAASIRIENTGNAYNLNTGSSTGFSIQQVGTATPFRIEPGAPSGTFRINSSGNVGIGTTSPSAGLHVANSAMFDGSSTFNGTSQFNGEVGVGRSPQSGTALMVRGQPDEIAFRVQSDGANATRFRVDANGGTAIGANTQGPERGLYVYGNTGIGTNTPEQRLHIRDTGRAALLIDAGADSQADFTLRENGVSRWAFRMRGDNKNFEIARRDTDGSALDSPIVIRNNTGRTLLRNGLQLVAQSEPAVPDNGAVIFTDSSSGDLKVKFPNGTVRTIASN